MAESNPTPEPVPAGAREASAAAEMALTAAPTLSWVFNPWRRRDKPWWRRPYYALAIELGIAVIAGYTFTQPNFWPDMLSWGGLSLLLLVGMTAAIFLPVRYRLDEEGVTVYFAGTTSFRDWSHYRNYYAHHTGVHLTTMPTPSALDPFRGHFLQYAQFAGGTTNRAAVVEFIAAHLSPPEPPAARP